MTIVTKKVSRINGSNGGKLLCTSDLSPVRSAAEIVGKNHKSGAIAFLESTVYPGVTEEIVVPILEQQSGMKCGPDFKVGYSPERVNPGDEAHSIDKTQDVLEAAGYPGETSTSILRAW